MKFRIKQEDDRFIPQYRQFFIWWNYCKISLSRNCIRLWFKSYIEAENFINKERDKNKTIKYFYLDNDK